MEGCIEGHLNSNGDGACINLTRVEPYIQVKNTTVQSFEFENNSCWKNPCVVSKERTCSRDQDSIGDNLSMLNSASTLVHSYANDPLAKTAEESVDDFLDRLSLLKTTPLLSKNLSIKIHHPQAARWDHINDIKNFIQLAYPVLYEHTDRIQDELYKASSDQAVLSMRQELTSTLEHLASSKNVLGGRWVVATVPQVAEGVWKTIAHATFRGSLGSAASVTLKETGDNNEMSYEFAVYTTDFTNKSDLLRVYRQFKQLYYHDAIGFVNPIRYECNYYDHLRLSSITFFKFHDCLKAEDIESPSSHNV